MIRRFCDICESEIDADNEDTRSVSLQWRCLLIKVSVDFVIPGMEDGALCKSCLMAGLAYLSKANAID